MTGYEMIRELKRQHGLYIHQFLALAPNNDPFYMGSPLDWEQARWFEAIWKANGFSKGTHLRRIHYRVAVQPDSQKHDGKPYENTERTWEYLLETSKVARALDLVDAANFDDHRNPDPYLSSWDRAGYTEPTLVMPDVPEFYLPTIDCSLSWNPSFSIDAPEVTGYGADDYSDRVYNLEIWIEKTTMDDILVPLCRELGVSLIRAAGTQSITNAIRLLERCKAINKPARVFEVTDFDPAGNDMPTAVARHLEFYRQRYAPEVEVKLIPLMLTAEQAEGLPRIPIKETDRRRSRFEALYGEGAVELDALEALRPGEFERIIREAVEPYLDLNINRRRNQALGEARVEVTRLWSERMQPLKADLAKIVSEYRLIATEYEQRLEELNEEFQRDLEPLRERLEPLHQALVERSENFNAALPERPTPEIEPPDESDWLFDSNRTFMEQLKFYWRRKLNYGRRKSNSPKKNT